MSDTPAKISPPTADETAGKIGDRLAVMEQLLHRIAMAAESQGSLREMLTSEEAAEMLGISYSKFKELDNAGDVPAAIHFGERLPRWSRTEMLAWIRAGSPARSDWQRLREIRMRNSA